ncbi:4'-phosphopantetheinyl transferase superfamily protein [Undibacterium sp. CY18W]|uniref:4'-phosphopantetheinyl transferase superfamily protein n=1 Tax=Undibacterium hunanense TaxID=2762292 RepID=A0ABR6ZQD9_9BURK|nr:4'-phosphopantetheinyl transferase superfamily protein [Undibacterium hunanense]MBC3918092.1 4'-phosphopantetheinyl transferase superfamily protein [Undibacterium hunanense]
MPEDTPPSSLAMATEVWVASLAQLREYRSGLQDLLNSTEQARCQRYLHQDDRDRYLGGRAVVKLAVARSTGLPVQDIFIALEASGKPSIAFAQTTAIQAPAISISHAGDLVIVALGYGADIGVDVELLHQDVNLDELMPVVCSNSEIAEVNRLDGKSRTQKFYEFWVLKEACLKATGDGLSADARRLIFSVDAASRVSLIQGLDHRSGVTWDFLLRQYDNQHVMALAIRRFHAAGDSAGNGKAGGASDELSYKDAEALLRDYCLHNMARN